MQSNIKAPRAIKAKANAQAAESVLADNVTENGAAILAPAATESAIAPAADTATDTTAPVAPVASPESDVLRGKALQAAAKRDFTAIKAAFAGVYGGASVPFKAASSFKPESSTAPTHVDSARVAAAVLFACAAQTGGLPVAGQTYSRRFSVLGIAAIYENGGFANGAGGFYNIVAGDAIGGESFTVTANGAKRVAEILGEAKAKAYAASIAPAATVTV